jgi:hypothetical protein
MLEVEVGDLMVVLQVVQEDKEEEELEDLQRNPQVLKMETQILVAVEVEQDLDKPNLVLVDRVVLVLLL